MKSLRITSIGYRVIENTLLFFLLFIALHVTRYTLHVTNAQSIDLSISPPLVELMIKPGKSVMIAYTVGNGNNPIVVTSHVGTFTPRGYNGQISLNPDILGPIRFNLENSDTALNKGVYLKSNQKQQYLLKIRVPNNTAPGDYYYTFYVKSDSGPLFTGQNTSKSTATIGSNILISVSENGNLDNKGRITQFRFVDNDGVNIFGKRYYFVESSSTIPISLIVENTDKNLIKPDGHIIINGPLGTLSKHKITPVNILSKSQRILPATPSAQLDHSLVLKGFFVGKHKVDADISFGAGSPPIKGRIEFVAIPLRLILGLIFMVIVSGVIIKKLKKPLIIE